MLIVGASGRAAAASVIRAGLRPFVIDLFADADTRRLGDVLICPFAEYPGGFVELARQAPPGPWLYTGGLENYPDIIAAISASRDLWGTGPEMLPLVRDPFRLASTLARLGVKFPTTAVSPHALGEGQRWLRKPLQSGGGLGIRFAAPDEAPAEGHYFQEFLAGSSMSAVYAGGARLGISRQLTNADWLHAPPFHYAGSIAPIAEASVDLAGIDTAGRHIAHTSPGLFGIDFISTGSNVTEPHIIEVNPRYTASVELFELATGVSALALAGLPGSGAGRPLERGGVSPTPSAPSLVFGKAIYYAPKLVTFPHDGPWLDSLAQCMDVWRLPDFADIPLPGAIIDRGQPVMTLFASSLSETECLERLKERARKLDWLLGVPPSPEKGSP